MTVVCVAVPGERDDDDRITLTHADARMSLTVDEARGLQIAGLPAALHQIARARNYRAD